MHRIVAVLALFLAACAKEPAQSGDSFATPEAAVAVFFKAAAAKDADLLSRCFSRGSEGEFKAFVEKTVSASMLDELQEMFQGASVTETRAGDDPDRASVVVKLPNHPRGKETLYLVREDGMWRVRGF